MNVRHSYSKGHRIDQYKLDKDIAIMEKIRELKITPKVHYGAEEVGGGENGIV